MSECCICFADIHKDLSNLELCYGCLLKLKEKDEKGRFIHPSKKTPIATCKCGKLFFVECERLTYGNVYFFDQARLEACKTPEERRALLLDPTALISQKGLHGLITE